jgi:hypothetical protein
MNRLPTPLLALAALFGATACGSTDTPPITADAGAALDRPAADAPDATTDAGSDLGVAVDLGAPVADVGTPPVDVGQPAVDVGEPAVDVGTPGGAGTCASPIVLAAEGTVVGGDLVLRGLTTGMPDELHPYEGCLAHDASEVVVSYRIPAGTGALMLTTEGSTYDTSLYVRTACSQAAGGADLACNNDSYDHAPQSTVYLTNVLEGQTVFIVIDGNAAMDTVPTGSFVLTVRRVPFGGAGAPCHPVTEPVTPRCTAPLRCSEGGGADGTALCLPVLATNAPCDVRSFTNICAEGVTCVTDPAPAEGVPPASLCTLPGVRPGAPCRAVAPRCDGAYACSAADPPTCVPLLSTGIGCDPAGEGNRCGAGLTCSPLGDGGAPICH